MYVKLPNGTIATPDENNFVTTTVKVDLHKFIDRNYEGVLDLLGKEAVGSDLLTDIQYEVTGAEGNLIALKVSGRLDMVDVEHVEENDLPEQDWTVLVTRISYGSHAQQVRGRCIDEALDAADAQAGNLLYSEHGAHYAFDAAPA